MARGAYPPADAGHPLLRLNPHDCVPFMDMLFADDSGSSKMDALPSPRLMASHMHHALLPASISKNPDCKIIYICSDPKGMLVSLWHFTRRIRPHLAFSEVFEDACEGVSFSGPIWDHVLGYWNASKESPETVLFLRYEEILLDPVDNVKKLARFVGQPFSPAEEEAGITKDIVRLCSFTKLKDLEINKAGPHYIFPNNSYFRRGEAGDWANHVTPEMARRLDAIMEEKLHGLVTAVHGLHAPSEQRSSCHLLPSSTAASLRPASLAPSRTLPFTRASRWRPRLTGSLAWAPRWRPRRRPLASSIGLAADEWLPRRAAHLVA